METNNHNNEIPQRINKTKWNEPLFQKDPSSISNDVENFQIMNMKYKLKQIKKANKRGENYKKIPLFDTLNNDLTPTVTDPIKTVDSPIKPDNNYGLDYIYTLFNSFFHKPVIEAIGAGKDGYECGAGDINCKNDTGGGPGYDDFIEQLYQRMLRFNKRMAASILTVFTNRINKPEKDADDDPDKYLVNKDIELVAHYIALLEAISFSSVVVFNWFYLIFYMQTDPKLVPYAFSTKTVKGWAKDNGLWGGFLFFFEYAMYFPEMVDTFLVQPDKPDNIFHPVYQFKPPLNSTFNFIILFFIILFIAIFFIVGLKDFLIALLSGKVGLASTTGSPESYSSIVFYIMGSIVTILFILDVASYQKQLSEKADAAIKNGDIADAIMTLMGTSVLTLIALFIYYLIRYIIIIIISVPIGATLCGLYFLFYSLFGILIYKGFDLSMINTITTYIIESSNFSSSIKASCTPPTWFSWLINKCKNILNVIMDILFLRIFTLTFMSMLLYAAMDFSKNLSNITSIISNKSLPFVMSMFAITIALFVGMSNFYTNSQDLIDQVLLKLSGLSPPSKEDDDIGEYKNDTMYDFHLATNYEDEGKS